MLKNTGKSDYEKLEFVVKRFNDFYYIDLETDPTHREYLEEIQHLLENKVIREQRKYLYIMIVPKIVLARLMNLPELEIVIIVDKSKPFYNNNLLALLESGYKLTESIILK